jgi:hypothetical protein
MTMTHIDLCEPARANPLDVVERIAVTNNWSFERAGDDRSILVRGKWTDYQISTPGCSTSRRCMSPAPSSSRCRMPPVEMLQLLSMINEQLWLGHFDLWIQDGIVMYRNALVLAGGVPATGGQCEALLATALDACERYFPAYQFVVWAGKPAREALDAAMFETAGEA